MAIPIGFFIPLNLDDYLSFIGKPQADRTNWCSTQMWWTNENIQLSGTTSSTTAKVGDKVTIQVGIQGVLDSDVSISRIKNIQAWVCYPNTMPGRADTSLIVHSMQPSNGGNPPSLDPSTTSNEGVISGSRDVEDYQDSSDGSYFLYSLLPPWEPQQDDIVPPNTEVHSCIVATCAGFADLEDVNNDDSGIPVGLTVSNNNLTPIDICTDPHQGQRNITIVSFSLSGGIREGLIHEFGFLSGAAQRDQRSQVVVEVSPVNQQSQIDPVVLKVLQSGPYHNLPLQPSTSKPRTLRLRKNDHECQGWLAQIICEAEEFIEEVIDAIEGDTDDRQGRRVKLTLPPNGLQPLVLQTEFDPSDSPGTVYVFDITQTDGDGQRGGIKLGVVVVP